MTKDTEAPEPKKGSSRPFFSISIKPEPHLGSGQSEAKRAPASDDPDLGQLLEWFPIRRFETTVEELSEKVEKDLQGLRKSHINKLFWLTVCWVFVVWVIVLLQGFSQWFFPWPSPSNTEHYLHFKLTDTILVAFITSTTATVLGLYGIAAYWLYGGRKKQPDKDAKQKEKKVKKDG